MASTRSIVDIVQGYSTSVQSNARFVSLSDTSARWKNDVDIVAKLLSEVAFGDQPKLTTKVDYLIDLLQFLNVRLKSRSWDVWDCLENASHPIFEAEFFRVSPQQIRGFVLVPTNFESR